MRTLLKAILLLIPFGVSGQSAWMQTLPMQGESMQVYDAVELSNGEWLAVVSSRKETISDGTPLAQSWTVLLDAEGQVAAITPLTAGTRSIKATTIKSANAGANVHILASAFDSLLLTDHGLVHFQANQLGEVTNTEFHIVGDGTMKVFANNATWDQDDHLLVVGGAYPPSVQFGLPNRLLLMRINPDGQELGQALIGIGLGYSKGLDVIWQDSLMMVSGEGLQNLGDFGYSQFMRFDTSFNYISGFPSTSVSGSGNALPPDSVMHDCLYMTPSGQGSIIVSSHFGTAGTGFRPVLGRLGPNGTQEALFMPYSGAVSDMCPTIQGHDAEADGNIVFSVAENFRLSIDLTLSPHSSRIRVYLLDTMLNVLCSQIAVDGALDSAYYYLNRVKATSDGGTLLMGSRLDLETPGFPQPWMMKLAPWDCLSGIKDPHSDVKATIYPNPGAQGFTATINGPTLNNGQLLLYDAQGGVVGRSSMQQSIASLDVSGAPAGIYLYRIVDSAGSTRASGRWVKQ